ncbi:hypothetical protein ABPG75_012602 [Micractinium tetrahymenae]
MQSCGTRCRPFEAGLAPILPILACKAHSGTISRDGACCRHRRLSCFRVDPPRLLTAAGTMQTCTVARLGALRPVCSSAQRRPAGPSARPIGLGLRPSQPAARREVAAAASAEPRDFDEFLEMVADKFEKVDNKPVVIGWLAGAFFAIVVAEWLIHVPLLNVLLGFPIQFVGLVITPYLALRYYVDKEGTPLADAEKLVNKYSEKLPGLKK